MPSSLSTRGHRVTISLMATILDQDTLSLVFIAAYDDTPSFATTSSLRSVNSFWMALADKIPHLWTKLLFTEQSHFANVDRARLHTQNSKNYPLDLNISLPQTDVLGTEKAQAIIALLREHVHRIRSFYIRAPAHEGTEALVAIGDQCAAPILQELTITVDACTDDYDIRDFISISTSFAPSPRLQRLEMPSWPLPKGISPHFSPALTSLSMDGTAFDTVDTVKILALIGACRCLETFKYKAADDFSYTPTARLDHPTTISLPRLKKVDVTAPGAGTDFLRAFNAPNLTDVRLDGYRPYHYRGRWVPSLTEPLSVTLQRVAARSLNLRRLELLFVKLQSPTMEYKRILAGEAFGSLEELTLNTVEVNDISLILAAVRGSSLRRIEFLQCKSITGSGLFEFAKRKGSHFSVAVEDCPGVCQDDLRGMASVVTVDAG